MNIEDAAAECKRWLAKLDQDRASAKAMQELAADRRAQRCTLDEARIRMTKIDSARGVTVYDGAKLEQAVKTILKHIGRET